MRERFTVGVQLPCDICYGPEHLLTASGMAVRMDSASMVIELTVAPGHPVPQVGDSLEFQVTMPVEEERAGRRYLVARAVAKQVLEMTGGTLLLTVAFRKTAFSEAGAFTHKRAKVVRRMAS